MTTQKQPASGRPMRAITRSGLMTVGGLSPSEASAVGRHDNAVRRYLDTGSADDLEEFEGVVIQGHELETSPDALDWYALTNDIRFEDIYAEGESE
jgi:hypothetical protein